jgi:hypothetical protein
MVDQLTIFKDFKPRYRPPPRIITTTSYNQQEILSNIFILYNKGRPPEIDVTFNAGNMYNGIPCPGIKSDINPIVAGCLAADAKALPYKNNSFKSVVFDPPFMIGGERYRMSKRYGTFPNIFQLEDMIEKSIKEIFRVLKTKGILIIKCQDQVEQHKNYFMHLNIIIKAQKIGFKLIDLFILINDNFIGQYNLMMQEHARKTHSFFLVFKK